jgi:hypothetical protein
MQNPSPSPQPPKTPNLQTRKCLLNFYFIFVVAAVPQKTSGLGGLCLMDDTTA